MLLGSTLQPGGNNIASVYLYLHHTSRETVLLAVLFFFCLHCGYRDVLSDSTL